jgi:putative GTP pyrophosphokinase
MVDRNLAGRAAARVKRLAARHGATGREEMAQQLMAHAATSEEFTAMMERNVAPFKRLMTYYQCAIMEVETKFKVLDAQYSLGHDRNPIESIKTRLKSTDSLAKKLVRKGFPMTVESIEQNIFDVAGVRVVCTFPEDLYALAEAFLAQDDVELLECKDYIANPKESGYRSLHLIVQTPIFLSMRSAW